MCNVSRLVKKGGHAFVVDCKQITLFACKTIFTNSKCQDGMEYELTQTDTQYIFIIIWCSHFHFCIGQLKLLSRQIFCSQVPFIPPTHTCFHARQYFPMARHVFLLEDWNQTTFLVWHWGSFTTIIWGQDKDAHIYARLPTISLLHSQSFGWLVEAVVADTYLKCCIMRLNLRSCLGSKLFTHTAWRHDCTTSFFWFPSSKFTHEALIDWHETAVENIFSRYLPISEFEIMWLDRKSS